MGSYGSNIVSYGEQWGVMVQIWCLMVKSTRENMEFRCKYGVISFITLYNVKIYNIYDNMYNDISFIPVVLIAKRFAALSCTAVVFKIVEVYWDNYVGVNHQNTLLQVDMRMMDRLIRGSCLETYYPFIMRSVSLSLVLMT